MSFRPSVGGIQFPNIMMDYQQNENEEKAAEFDGKSEDKTMSVFDERTEEASASQYFQFYGYLAQQQNMMQDFVRTSTYQKAVLSNLSDFKDKVVLDVGAGSGILSFFAAQAGAKHVYAVEASSMAIHCETLVKANGYENRITVVPGKIEDIQIPEEVDTIISEPMGYMLLNERMLESFLHAKKFMKPEGKMYPSRGDLHIAPFSDEALYLEQCTKANFWCQESFHGVNLGSLRQQALKEYFRQPVVDTFHVGILLAPSIQWTLDFTKRHEEELHRVEIPLEYIVSQTSYVHGLAFWFDVAFIGTNQTVWLSTAPTEPLTHWYQVRCLLEKPILCRQGSVLSGYVHLMANKRQSYDVEICLQAEGVVSNDGGPPIIQVSKNTLDLKNPCFRYTGQPVQPPPGYHQQPGTGNETGANILTSPTDAYWQSAVLAAAAAQQSTIVENGGAALMNGSGSTLPTDVSATSAIINSRGVVALDSLAAPMNAIAAAGTGINVPTIGNVVSLLPSGHVVPLSPTSCLPPTPISAAFSSSPAQLSLSPHAQIGAVQGACLPVAGTMIQQPLQNMPVSTYHPVAPDDYYLTTGVRGDTNEVAPLPLTQDRRFAPMNESLANPQHFAYQASVTVATTVSGQKV